MTKRSMSQTQRASKRRRTLTAEVKSLKRQVNANKHELKYYDATSDGTTDRDTQIITNTGTPKAIIRNNTGNSDYTFMNVPNSAGRRIYVKRIEFSSLEAISYATLWIQKRGDILNKAPDFNNKFWPQAFDPEYHLMLREYRPTEDNQKETFKWDISFDGKGRLVEFDSFNSTGDVSGDITRGGMWLYFDDTDMAVKPRFNVRVWYTDG